MPVAAGTIIVGYDGAPASLAAAERAAVEAGRRNAALHLVTCCDPPLDTSQGTAIEHEIHRARQVVDGLRVRVAASHPHLEVRTTVSRGPAYSELCQTATDGGELIFVGAGSHRRRSRPAHDTTPQRLVRHATCPVLVAPLGSADRPHRIIVGIDGSDDSDRALLWAFDEAQRTDVVVVVVHAWSRSSARDERLAPAHARIDAAVTLESSVERAPNLLAVRIVDMLIEHNPISALLSVASPDDLLVLASRGRGAVHSPIYGSTVRGVLERSPAGVIVLPSMARSRGHT